MAGHRSLVDQLEKEQIEWPAGANQYFLPEAVFETLFTYDNVKQELQDQLGHNVEGLENYANQVCDSRKRLFAILLSGQFSKIATDSILNFVKEGLTDSDLPLLRYEFEKEPSFWLCTKYHPHHGHDNCAVTIMQNWKRRDIKEFSRVQWFLQAPVFRKVKGEIPHYDFHYNTVLPFRKEEKGRCHKTGYSHVWPVRIVKGHQELYWPTDEQDTEPLLAIKQLLSGEEDEFKRETDMLTALTKVKHHHLVELLATYKHREKYHLLFPFAQENLRTFWDSVPIPNYNKTTYLWVLDQMTSLAAALNAIHEYQSNMAYEDGLGNPGFTRFKTAGRVNLTVIPGDEKFGRHGDLKPENILWVKKAPHGILVIADLGLGKFHRKDSRSRVKPEGLGGSQTYIPPELSLKSEVSRAYDIWSLGCVFLEFITWLLEGSPGLEVFINSRLSPALDGVVDDTYYTAIPSQNGEDLEAIVRPTVTTWIGLLRTKPGYSKMVGEVLDLIEKHLLVVERQARIKASHLYSKLKEMIEESQKNPEYLTGRKVMDEGAGFKTPDRLSI